MENLKNNKHTNYFTDHTDNFPHLNLSENRESPSQLNIEELELKGCSLKEAENILGKHAKPVNPFINKYEIILEKYLFGLFFKRLHITTNMSGEITDYYARIDLR